MTATAASGRSAALASAIAAARPVVRGRHQETGQEGIRKGMLKLPYYGSSTSRVRYQKGSLNADGLRLSRILEGRTRRVR